MSAHQLRFSASGYTGSVHLDGQDISRAVRDVTVKMRAGDVPQVTLDLALLGFDESDLNAEVHLAEPTRDLLTRLGWTPPGENSQVSAHIENFVAGSPEDLAAQRSAHAGAALTSPHQDVEAADSDQLLTVLFNGRYFLAGDEDGGVELGCRDHVNAGQPLGYYGGMDRYPDPAVPCVSTVPALLDIAAQHETDRHRDG